MKNLSPIARAYITAIILLGACAFFSAWYIHADRINGWLLAIGCVAVVFTARIRVKLYRTFRSPRTGNVNEMAMSLAFIPTFLLLLCIGPFAGAIAGLCNMESPFQRVPPHRRLFNAAAIILPVMAAWAVLQPFGLAPGTWDFFYLVQNQQIHQMLLPLVGIAIATGVYYVVNTGIVAAVIGIISKQNPLQVWWQQCLWMGPGYFAGASCATLILAILPNLVGSDYTWLGLLVPVAPIPVVIYLLNRFHEKMNEEKQSRIDVLSKQQAELEQMNAALKTSQESLKKLYTSTVESLALAIDAKDRYTKEHIQRVKGIAVVLAAEMGITGDDLQAIETGALLHDIGKIAVPEHILTKPGRLSEDEYAKIKAHPEMGARILEPVPFPFPVMPIVRHHHERWDGSGYPDGLVGEDIPLGGRILAVADVYDAVTSDRSYRRGWPHERALTHLQENAGSHFDPDVVTAFLRVVERHPELFAARKDADAAAGEGDRSVFEAVSAGGKSFEYVALYEISQAISTTVNLDEMLTMLVTKIRHLYDASACAVLLTDAPGVSAGVGLLPGSFATGHISSDTTFAIPTARLAPATLQVRSVAGGYDRLFEHGLVRIGAGVTGMAAARGVGAVASFDPNDIFVDGPTDRASESEPLQSMVVAPLTVDNEVIGTINVYQNHAYAFDSEALRVLEAIAQQAGRALLNAIEFDRTLESALTDALTGLHNARHMNQFLERALDRAAREELPLTVMVLDLDNFKPVNDRFGHTWGNEVLRELGGLFQGALRSGDLVARYAGDEFVIILTEAGATEARLVIDKIRAAIQHYDARPPDTADKTMSIEVSIGTASYPEDGADARSLINIADRAMFRDKKQRKGENIIGDELAARSFRLVA